MAARAAKPLFIMTWVFLILFIILLFNGAFRYILFHFFELIPLSIQDFIHFLTTKKTFDKFGIDMYCGYFGEGKTIKAVDTVLFYKKKYPEINVFSNIHIACDYKPIHSWNVIIEAPPNSIFLVDEVSTLLHARNWKEFPTDLMRTMFQCRKNHKYLIMTAQRFHHVDKTVRDVTDHVFQQSHDFWRIHHTCVYDAWDLENCINIKDILPQSVFWWHRSNAMYRHYDTDYVVNDIKSYDYISNSDIVNRQGSHSEALSFSSKNSKYRKGLKKYKS